MAEIKINFSDYKASGVYFLEKDNSVINQTTTQNALRLAVGFNHRGPFNRPVYVDGVDTFDSLFGGIDRNLERRGCFTNRNIRTMLNVSPVFALNLLNVDTKDSSANLDTVGMTLITMDSSIPGASVNNSGHYDSSVPYAFLYDRSKFWVADDDEFVSKTFGVKSGDMVDSSVAYDMEKSAYFGFGNCGTKDMSIIVRKAEGLSGYNITFRDFYGSDEAIPYRWINPNDFLSDYFIQVIAISGRWGSDDASVKYSSYTGDSFWGQYIDASGLKKDKVGKFLRLDQINVIGNWTGCILPDFYDKQGNNKSIEYMINKTCNETGLMVGINKDAFETVSHDSAGYFIDYDMDSSRGDGDVSVTFAPDFVGHTLKDSYSPFKYMSCVFDSSGIIGEADVVDSSLSGNKFVSTTSLEVGSFVESTNGFLTKITKKRAYKSDSSTLYEYTATDTVKVDSSTVSTHKQYQDAYTYLDFIVLPGLKISARHMPGYSYDRSTHAVKADNEAGVDKIYAMLEDEGLRKGLLNDDMIDFRYIVDTFAYGLGDKCGAKRYLAELSRDKKHCLAIINAPSMTQFASSTEPFFGETLDKASGERSSFNVKYIPEGGNQDLVYSYDTESFTLPDFDSGADRSSVFAPFLKYGDGSRTILVPPAADISNAFMSKFMGGNPYSTVANKNGILRNSDITGLEMLFDDEERGYLEKFGINPLINRAGTVMIYGDRTCYQDYDSDLNFIHVREILNTIQIICKSILQDYVYTYNTPLTRGEIVSRINPILSAMKDSKALAKYEIECDDFNNTKEVIDNKFCIAKIAVWINQNMEKIVVPIVLNRSTTA